MLFSQDPVDAISSLASGGTNYVLAFLVVTLIGVLVWVFRSAMPRLLETYRADMREQRSEFYAELHKRDLLMAQELGKRDDALERLTASIDGLRTAVTSKD